MQNRKVELIRNMIASGHISDLLALMEGESRHTTEASEGVPSDRNLARIWMGALYHLRFIAAFGPDAKARWSDGKFQSPVPEEFAKWLDAGAPGIGESDLESYVQDKLLVKPKDIT
jgi:hypothetical protein